MNITPLYSAYFKSQMRWFSSYTPVTYLSKPLGVLCCCVIRLDSACDLDPSGLAQALFKNTLTFLSCNALFRVYILYYYCLAARDLLLSFLKFFCRPCHAVRAANVHRRTTVKSENSLLLLMSGSDLVSSLTQHLIGYGIGSCLGLLYSRNRYLRL